MPEQIATVTEIQPQIHPEVKRLQDAEAGLHTLMNVIAVGQYSELTVQMIREGVIARPYLEKYGNPNAAFAYLMQDLNAIGSALSTERAKRESTIR